MKLFDNKNRVNLKPAKSNENTYDYLNNSAREEVEEVRNKLEKWFSIYPEEEKFEIKRRIKTREQFDSTFFEMYLYNLFTEMNFNIESHPEIKDSDNKPDFLISKVDKQIYVEAKVDYNLSEKEKKERRKLNHLIDSINSINNNKYKLILEELNILSKDQPSMKKFRNHLQNQFLELNYKEVIEKTKEDFSILKTYTYSDDDLYIEYKIIGIPEIYNDNRLIQIEGFRPVEWINCHISLRDSLFKKSSRYGEMEVPFIIAVNCLDYFLDEDDVRRAVLGDIKTSLYFDNRGELAYSYDYHEDNGFFSYNHREQNNNVSGVLVYKLGLGNIDNPKYWFIYNPNAKYPLDLEDISLDSIIFKDGEFIKE